MSIELMKKLEDLKQTRSRYGKEISNEITQKKNRYIQEVVNDFSKFFNEKGFTITTKKNEIKASYGQLETRLSHDDPSTNFMGVQFRFELDLTSLNQNNLVVVLNRVKPGISMSSFSSVNSSEKDQLKNEISQTEKEIEEVKQRLENIDSEKWSLFIKNDNPNPGYQFSEPYPSMYELLTELIK